MNNLALDGVSVERFEQATPSINLKEKFSHRICEFVPFVLMRGFANAIWFPDRHSGKVIDSS